MDAIKKFKSKKIDREIEKIDVERKELRDQIAEKTKRISALIREQNKL